MRIFLTIVLLSLVACSDRDQQKIDSKPSVVNTPDVASSVMATSAVIAASQVSSVSGVIAASGVAFSTDSIAASSSVQPQGWVNVFQLKQLRQDIGEVSVPAPVYDCPAEFDNEPPPTSMTKKERLEYERSKRQEYDLELKKCDDFQKNVDSAHELTITDFNHTWIPVLKHAVDLGDPVAEVILRKCDIAPILDRTSIASNCSEKEEDRKFAQTRLEAINSVFPNSLNCKGCDAFQLFDKKFKELLGAPVSAAVVSAHAHAAPAHAAAASAEEAKQEREPGKIPAMVPIPDKNYEMGKYDVTQKEWRDIMGGNPSNFKNCGDTCPVEQVSWDDVQEFIQKLNAKTGKKYRLPTEAEWEYACYGGSKTEYCGGNDIDAVAWHCGPLLNGGNSNGTTHPVGQKQANGYGLYDMSGNVDQWMKNKYDNEEGLRVIRGSTWDCIVTEDESGMESLSAAFRTGSEHTYRNAATGFRLARTLP